MAHEIEKRIKEKLGIPMPGDDSAGPAKAATTREPAATTVPAAPATDA
jgi:recombination protein RecA